MRKGNGMCNVFTGLLIGAAAGAVAAILFAPQSGQETREKLMSEAERLKREFEKYTNDFSEKASKIREEIEIRLADIKSKLQSSAEEVATEAKGMQNKMGGR